MKASVMFDGPVPAPVTKGEEIGKLRIEVDGMPPIEQALIAGADVPKRGLFGRFVANVRHLLLGS
jgi:D-alanyl-D-alanine carboxypeptidase (penicillin-binding protein 5/6)